MKDTRCGSNCCFVKSGFCKNDHECPYFIQNYWANENNESPELISDCFPKRFMLEQNTMTNRCLNLTATTQDLRNELDSLKNLVNDLVNIMGKLVKASFPEDFKAEKELNNNLCFDPLKLIDRE